METTVTTPIPAKPGISERLARLAVPNAAKFCLAGDRSSSPDAVISRLEALDSVIKDLQLCRAKFERSLYPDTVDRIIHVVSSVMDVPVELIRGRSREGRIPLARQVAMSMAWQRIPSSSEVARRFKLCHGTVVYAAKAVEARLRTDADFRNIYQSIVTQLETELDHK